MSQGETPYLIRPEWDGDEVLVEEGGDEEGHSGRHQLGVRPIYDRNEEVTDEPTLDGRVSHPLEWINV
jgi:hypothetical protein